MGDSPIEQVLAAIDHLDLDGLMALMAPDTRLLTADGRRAEGAHAVRELFADFLGQLRTATYRITAQWHLDDVWIAEADVSYELRDWTQINAVPRVFVLRRAPAGITELRVYGAHEQQLADHRSGEEGMWIGARWIPPL